MRSEISVDHEYFRKHIENRGWENVTKFYPDLKEHSFSTSYFIEKELFKKIKEINSNKLNQLSNSQINKILDEVKEKIKSPTLSEFSNYVKHGIPIEDPSNPSVLINIKLIDFDNVAKNSFIYAHELRFEGISDDEPDFTLFVNGIPLAIAEIKSEAIIDSENEALNQLARYEGQAPELAKMVHLGFAIGMKKGYVPMYPNYDYPQEKREKKLQVWKINNKEDIYALLNPNVLLNFIKYYVFVINSNNNYYRIAARYNQYRAAEKSFERIREYLEGRSDKNKGLIWHWLGSGKTYTMFFIAYKFLINYSNKFPIIFIIVDRQDLERQHSDAISKIDDQFLTQYKNINKINSIAELHDIIKQIKESEFKIGKKPPRGIYIVTIQKFQKGELENEEKEGIINLLCKLKDEYLQYLKDTDLPEYIEATEDLSKLENKAKIKECFKLGAPKKKEVLFLIDEAHRSQYGSLASIRKLAFPNAINLGFTGTPVFRTDKNTLEEFSYPELGEYYLDVYFISDSIKDGFTLPIMYKSITEGEEGIRFQLDEKEIEKYTKEYLEKESNGEDISEYFEGNLNISDEQLGKIINDIKVFLLNPKRIDALAKYIAESILVDTQTIDLKEKSKDSSNIPSKFKFKAIIVMANRKACVLMKRALDKYLAEMYGDQANKWSEIVMTYNYNENDPDIRQYMDELKEKYKNSDFNAINAEIQDNFKNLSDPRILIVTDMLITGFDAPQLRVMYLDKPIHTHKLLQAIGRVNRPAPGKQEGLVVDSIGLLSNLQDTLNKYNMLLSQDNKTVRDELNATLKSEESEEEKFKKSLYEIKSKLKSLKVDGEDLGIDLQDLENDVKTQENWISKYEDKIRKIAFYYSLQDLELMQSDNLLRQISELKAVINNLISIVRFYNSLSPSKSASPKIIYKDEIELIKQLLRLIYKQIGKVSGSNNKLLEEILDLIYNASEIDLFKENESAIISEESLRKIGEMSEKEINNKVYEYFLEIPREIQNDADLDPFYKKVLEKLDKLKKEWIARKQSTKDVLQQLKTINEQIRIYSENRNKKDNVDKILYSIKLALAEEYGESCKEIRFDKLSALLNNIKNEIKNRPRIDAESLVESKRTELEMHLKLDIYLSNCNIANIDDYIEELVDNIVSQIMNLLYENGE